MYEYPSYDHYSCEHPSQAVAFKYCVAALGMFGLQVLVASGAAFLLVFPGLPAPVPFNAGRAFHTNISVYWPLLGLMGAAYYFLVGEAGVDLYSTRLANVQFWIFLLTVAAILGSVVLGITRGREYLDAPLPLYAGLAGAFTLFAYNVVQTLRQPRANWKRPTVLLTALGVVSTLLFLGVGVWPFVHPTLDEMFRFFYFHLWEELSFELVGTAALASALILIAGVNRRPVERLLYVEGALVALSASFSTSHHFYWTGTPAFWLPVGQAFSALQVVPILLIVLGSFHGIRGNRAPGASVISLGLFLSSAFWHLLGAGIMGAFLALPRINRYAHGTLLTSAHSHLALFGVFGFLVLGLCHFILTRGLPAPPARVRMGVASVALLNAGLAAMGLSLGLGGGMQTYLWRVAGLDFVQTQVLLKPYLLGRALGGVVFAAGAWLLIWNTAVLSFQVRHFAGKNKPDQDQAG